MIDLFITDDQKRLSIVLDNFIRDSYNNRFLLINGRAGTGKTHSITNYFKFVKPDIVVQFSAFTNKAVKILGNNAITIHKLLKFIQYYSYNGEVIFSPNTNITYTREYDIIVFDECSMISKRLFKEIIRYNEQTGTKFIFVGDICQLPPLYEKRSLTFDECFYKVTLNQIVRTKNDKLMKTLEFFRSLQDDYEDKSKIGKMKLLIHKNARIIDNLDKFIDKYCKLALSDDNLDRKIITWTNKRMNYYNNEVRKRLYGSKAKTSKYIPGEKLIFNDFYEIDELDKYYTGDEIIIESVEKMTKTFVYHDTPINYRVYIINGKFDIVISTKVYNALLNQEHDRQMEELEENRDWSVFHDIKKLNAPLVYGYCITAHKSQGSTYHDVFVDHTDISMNGNIQEMYKCLYTACSRASNSLYIFEGNHDD